MKTRLFSRSWILPALFMLSLSFNVQALDAEEVVRLRTSGYSDDQINEVLSATRATFMLTAREVVYLSQSGVGDLVIQNMLVALPLQPLGADATVQAEPVLMLFNEEDLQMLAQARIAEHVVVTFIETRDLGFALNQDRLTSLRQSGLGLDALQLLVEKSAAGLPVPLAPPPEPVVAGSGSPAPYFYGNSGSPVTYRNSYTTYTTYGDPYSGSGYGSGYGPYYNSNYGPSYDPYYGSSFGFSYFNSPFLFFHSRSVYPWHGYSGYSPSYVTHYPYGYGYYGYRSHDVFCPRHPHHHGSWNGRHNDRDRDHDDYDHDSRDREHDQGQQGRNTVANTNRGASNSIGSQSGRGADSHNGRGNNPVRTNIVSPATPATSTAPVAFNTYPRYLGDTVSNRGNTSANADANSRTQTVVPVRNDDRGDPRNAFNGTGATTSAAPGNGRSGTTGNYSGIFNGFRPATAATNAGEIRDVSSIINGGNLAPKATSVPRTQTQDVRRKPFAGLSPVVANAPALTQRGPPPQASVAERTVPEKTTEPKSETRRGRNNAEPAVNAGSGRREKQR